MIDALTIRSSTKAALHAAMVRSTLRLGVAVLPQCLASQIRLNQLAPRRHASLPNDALHQNRPAYRAGPSPSDPTGRLFVHSH